MGIIAAYNTLILEEVEQGKVAPGGSLTKMGRIVEDGRKHVEVARVVRFVIFKKAEATPLSWNGKNYLSIPAEAVIAAVDEDEEAADHQPDQPSA